MEKYAVNKTLLEFETRINDLNRTLNKEQLENEQRDLNLLMQDSNFWNNLDKAKEVTKRVSDIKEQLDTLKNLNSLYQDLLEWVSMSKENTEEWLLLEEEIVNLENKLKSFEMLTLLSGTYDYNNAILELHPGAGGTESLDWALMLYRMYLRYATRKGYKVEVLDYQAGDEAGIKSVTFLVKGPYAYGYLKAEKGVHRLVRISPFDANSKRHTSFVSLDVLPEINDEVSIEIKEEDLKIDVYRSSGAGGQSVNTTDSAVRITHIPSAIIVTCQNERSQIKNKERALGILKSKLIERENAKKDQELKEIQGEQKEIAWGSQIRSYVFHPYQMVKDHRTNFEVGNTLSVMDGDLDGFISAFLKR